MTPPLSHATGKTSVFVPPYASAPAPRRGFFDDFHPVQGLAGGVAGTLIGAGGILGSTLYHTPGALWHGYRALAREPRLGRNAKLLAGLAVIPEATLLAQPMAAVGGAVYGLGAGFYAGVERGFGEAVRESRRFTDAYDAYAEQWVRGLAKYKADPLDPGETPFEISFLQGAKAFVGGVVSPATLAPAVGALALWRTPKGWWRAVADIWQNPDWGFVKKGTWMGLATLAAPLAAPLCLTAGALWAMGEGIVEGYNNGVMAAWEKAAERVRWFNAYTKDFLAQPL